MLGHALARDTFEAFIVVAVGCILWSSVRKLRAGRVRVYECTACGRPTSRAYPRCKHCDAVQPHGR